MQIGRGGVEVREREGECVYKTTEITIHVVMVVLVVFLYSPSFVSSRSSRLLASLSYLLASSFHIRIILSASSNRRCISFFMTSLVDVFISTHLSANNTHEHEDVSQNIMRGMYTYMYTNIISHTHRLLSVAQYYFTKMLEIRIQIRCHSNSNASDCF